MKKGLKIAGAIAGIAALAALTPYSVNKYEDKTTVYALLWKYTNKPDPENPGKRTHVLDLGFHNPVVEENDELLMGDDEDLIFVEAPETEDVLYDAEPAIEPEAEGDSQEACSDCQPEC